MIVLPWAISQTLCTGDAQAENRSVTELSKEAENRILG